MPFKLPPTYLLKTHFEKDQDELHRLEKEINVVWDIRKAKIVLGRVHTKERAKHDLRVLGLDTEEVVRAEEAADDAESSQDFALPERKRRKADKTTVDGKDIIVSDTSMKSKSETEEEDVRRPKRKSRLAPKRKSSPRLTSTLGSSPVLEAVSSMTNVGSQTERMQVDIIRVFSLTWYTDSIKTGKLLPMEPPHLIYEGRILPNETTTPDHKSTKLPATILARARADTPPPAHVSPLNFRKTRSPTSQTKTRPSQLLHEDTSDHEREQNMPPIPEYLKTRWCCQRPTPLHSPNDAFISQLKIIRQARELESNEVVGHGFSAKSYSGAIAAIAAYPYTITSLKEIMRLPGCGEKVGAAWHEWKEHGEIQEVKDIENDERLKSLKIFYGIHQVGEATAREFYDKHGWRDLDDVILHGWSILTRDQKIGLKYYDELALRIPRKEVASTGATILHYANAIHPGFKICIVGGYRRGKPDSGDMDFILSHPDEDVTKDFLGPLLDALGIDHGDGWITHELTVSHKNSERGQETLPWRGSNKKAGKRSGFDTLDHAFVVWQDPNFKGDGENPNVHRRVDIIISPWKTAGCAVLGWSGGTQFERDLRSYCRNVKKWKFDSSGVRDLGNGSWVDLESREGDGVDLTLEEKEKRVFEGLELEYRVPTERCTH